MECAGQSSGMVLMRNRQACESASLSESAAGSGLAEHTHYCCRDDSLDAEHCRGKSTNTSTFCPVPLTLLPTPSTALFPTFCPPHRAPWAPFLTSCILDPLEGLSIQLDPLMADILGQHLVGVMRTTVELGVFALTREMYWVVGWVSGWRMTKWVGGWP